VFRGYERACSLGFTQGCTELARLLYTGAGEPHGIARDRVRALNLYQQACNLAEPNACVQLATIEEQLPAANAKVAVEHLNRACTDTAVVGCTRLGEHFAAGVGVAVDLGKARALFERSCTAGDLNACADLGDLYRDGHGVARDRIRALSLYDRACTSVATACTRAGRLYSYIGRDSDAQDYYRLACQRGDNAGCLLHR
jgi:TPR repeat protein